MSDQAQEMTDEERAELQKAYYNTANGVGALLSDVVRANAQLGTYAGSPHYRAVVGGGMTAAALTELHKHDAGAAKEVFDELVTGLLQLGKTLDFVAEGGADDDAA